jgi:hypothetical protein
MEPNTAEPNTNEPNSGGNPNPQAAQLVISSFNTFAGIFGGTP